MIVISKKVYKLYKEDLSFPENELFILKDGENQKTDLTSELEETNITSVMVDEKQQTIEKIKQTALEEFYENGYAKASLRTICRRAGVTTGAMYFHFENKEALLRAILEPLMKQYELLQKTLMQQELQEPENGAQLDVQMMRFVLEHRREAILVMEKVQGSCYEQYRSVIESMMEQAIETFYKSRMLEPPDPALISILAKIRLDGCLEILKGNYDMEYSLYLTEKIGIYAAGGTEKLIQDLNELHG